MMRKKIRLITWGLILAAVISSGPAQAADKKEKRRPAPGAGPGVAANIKGRDLLRSQEWVIYLRPFKDAQAKPQVDILSFSPNNRFSSKNLSGKGYKEAGYALSSQTVDAAVVWETMQDGPEGAIASWRGELKDKAIQGILTLLSKDGSLEDFYFTTVLAEDEKK